MTQPSLPTLSATMNSSIFASSLPQCHGLNHGWTKPKGIICLRLLVNYREGLFLKQKKKIEKRRENEEDD